MPPRPKATHLDGLRGRTSSTVVDLHLVDVDCGKGKGMIRLAQEQQIHEARLTLGRATTGADVRPGVILSFASAGRETLSRQLCECESGPGQLAKHVSIELRGTYPGELSSVVGAT